MELGNIKREIKEIEGIAMAEETTIWILLLD